MWRNLSKSASAKQVSKTRVLYKSQVSKTQDAILLNLFKCGLTYYMEPPYYASSQIPSKPGGSRGDGCPPSSLKKKSFK